MKIVEIYRLISKWSKKWYNYKIRFQTSMLWSMKSKISSKKIWSWWIILLLYLFFKIYLPTITTGGDTNVRINRHSTKIPTIKPRRFIKSISVILTAFADFTRKIMDILWSKNNHFKKSFTNKKKDSVHKKFSF